jgi:hypothetical protein
VRLNEAELSPRFHRADAGLERALFRILGMIATCLGALSSQAPKPAGAAPLARGLDGESALRAIMANAMGRSSWNTTGTGLSRKSTLEQNALQPLDNPRSARGCHPCHRNVPLPMSPVRTKSAKCWWQDLNLRPVRAMALGTLLRVDTRAISGYSCPWRQTGAVWLNADVLGGDVGGAYRFTEIGRLGGAAPATSKSANQTPGIAHA